MPIEFRCSQCNQLLRVPETAAGKQARCPKCQALMAVPAAAADVVAVMAESTSTGGVAPLLSPAANPFAGEMQSTIPSPAVFSDSPASLNPYASPASAGQGYTADYYYFGPRTGLPWDNEPRTLGCFFRTMGLVLGSPTRAFSIMLRNGGLGIPLLYNLYSVGVLMAIGMMFLAPIFTLIMIFGEDNDPVAMAGIAGGLAIVGLVYLLVLVLIAPMIGAAAMHVMLLMVGGAKQGFETTFRVTCYAYYSALLPTTFLYLIPYLGAMGAMVWITVLLVHGLARGHEISGGKATVAVLLPAFLCCGGMIGLVIAAAIWG